MNINELINEAKKRYEVGDRFRVVHQPDRICTIESFNLHDDTIIINPDGSWHFNLPVIEDKYGATVCHKGKWAEKVESVFVTEDGKNIYEGMQYYKVFNNSFIDSDICRNNTSPHLGFVYFSTEEEAKNYVNKQLKANTGKFKVGDRVRLTRKCKSYEGDWDGIWAFADAYVGGNYTILSSDNQYGYQLDIKLWFPEFVLEKVVTKYLADEFQVLKLEPYEDELPTSPKGKLFDTLEEANAYHELVKPNTYTVELPKGYEVKREYVVLGSNTVDGIYLKLKHI